MNICKRVVTHGKHLVKDVVLNDAIYLFNSNPNAKLFVLSGSLLLTPENELHVQE